MEQRNNFVKIYLTAISVDETLSHFCRLLDHFIYGHFYKLNISLNTEVLVVGKQTFVTCKLQDLCLGSDPKVTWKGLSSKKFSDIRYPRKIHTYLIFSQQLLYTPVPEDHQAEIICEATFG